MKNVVHQSHTTKNTHQKHTEKNCQLNNVFSLNYSGSLLRDENANYYELVEAYNVSYIYNIHDYVN